MSRETKQQGNVLPDAKLRQSRPNHKELQREIEISRHGNNLENKTLAELQEIGRAFRNGVVCAALLLLLLLQLIQVGKGHRHQVGPARLDVGSDVQHLRHESARCNHSKSSSNAVAVLGLQRNVARLASARFALLDLGHARVLQDGDARTGCSQKRGSVETAVNDCIIWEEEAFHSSSCNARHGAQLEKE